MAGNEIYIGNLFESMIESLASVVDKSDDQITELIAVRTSILSGQTSLNIIASETLKQSVANTLQSVTTPSGTRTDATVKTGIVQATGSIRAKASIKINTAGSGALAIFWVEVNGVKYEASTTSDSYVTLVVNAHVVANQSFKVGIAASVISGRTASMDANSLTFSYDLNDISSSGVVNFV